MTDILTDITDRIVALAGDISGIDSAGKVFPDDLTANLPFCFVFEDEANYERPNSNLISVKRNWIMQFYVQEFTPENATQEASARAACRPFLISVPTFFYQHTRLQRNDQGLNSVVRALLAEDKGIQSASRNQRFYMGFAFRLNVEYELDVLEV